MPITLLVRRPPKESRGRSESPLGRNIIENKDVPQKMLPEGVQRAIGKPSGSNANELLQVERSLAQPLLCQSRGLKWGEAPRPLKPLRSPTFGFPSR